MSNETISVSRDDLTQALSGEMKDVLAAQRKLRALLAQPAEQHQGEPVTRHPDAIIEGVMTSVGITHAIYASTVSLKHGEQVKLYVEQPAPVAVALPEQWLPIETAPKDETEIILRKGDRVTSGAWIEWSKSEAEFSSRGDYLGQVEYDSGAHWASWDGGFCEDDEPTHWQPLPIPPQQ